MDYTSSAQAFDFLATCYIYGCIAYVGLLFGLHLYSSLSADYSSQNKAIGQSPLPSAIESDFYEQVKDLLAPATEPVLAMEIEQPDFETMTIRELRSHIKENRLQQHIRASIGKTVKNARKYELIASLKAI